MGRATAILFGDGVDPLTRRTLAAVLTGELRAARRRGTPLPQDDDEELALFRDYDPSRSGGYFRYDDEECRSRRLDMRGPLDLDRGPIEMDEAEGEHADVCLEFR